MWVREVTQEVRALLEPMVQLASRDPLETRERPVQQVRVDLTGNQDLQERLAPLESKAPQEATVAPVPQERLVRPDRRETAGHLESLVEQDPLDRPVRKVPEATRERRDELEAPELRVIHIASRLYFTELCINCKCNFL